MTENIEPTDDIPCPECGNEIKYRHFFACHHNCKKQTVELEEALATQRGKYEEEIKELKKEIEKLKSHKCPRFNGERIWSV